MIIGGIIKGNEEAFWGDRYIYDLDYSDGFVSIFLCQNTKLYILSCGVYFMPIIPP